MASTGVSRLPGSSTADALHEAHGDPRGVRQGGAAWARPHEAVNAQALKATQETPMIV